MNTTDYTTRHRLFRLTLRVLYRADKFNLVAPLVRRMDRSLNIAKFNELCRKLIVRYGRIE